MCFLFSYFSCVLCVFAVFFLLLVGVFFKLQSIWPLMATVEKDFLTEGRASDENKINNVHLSIKVVS